MSSAIRFCCVALLLAACGPVVPPVTPELVTHAKTLDASSTESSLQAGRALYVARCGGCHSLPRLSEKSAADWPEVIDSMGTKAKLTEEQRKTVLRYVLAAKE